MFKHNHTKDINLDTNKVIVIDNCSIMDLSWNLDLVENINNAVNNMTVQGNEITLAVTHKETVPIYKQYVWFSKDAITNIIDIKILIKKRSNM